MKQDASNSVRPLAAQRLAHWLRSTGAHDLASDSRKVVPGSAFLALAGRNTDGRRFIGQALDRGAAAILVEADSLAPYSSVLSNTRVPARAIADLAALLGPIAAAFWDEPAQSMAVMAVTGTNGKTTVANWLQQACFALEEPTAVVGTLGARFLQVADDVGLTTPDPLSLHAFLSKAKAAGARALAIEASSIGLDQGRLNGLPISIAAFTNLTRDHLDYHGTMEAYGEAKARLFDWPGLAAAVINLDDPFSARLIERCRSQGVFVFGYSRDLGRAGVEGVGHFIGLDAVEWLDAGQAFDLCFDGERERVVVNVLGVHNQSNLLAVAGVLRARGYPFAAIARAISKLEAPSGRLEVVGATIDGEITPLVVVDYAHTPDALENALNALRPVAYARSGRLFVVFGCGGDRDPGKRPTMGAIATRLADQVVVTSDNPRTENPAAIIEAVMEGIRTTAFNTHEPVLVELDRRLAIEAAIAIAEPEDVILIAGKGHENYQDFGTHRIDFSDLEVSRAALNRYARGPIE